MTVWTVPATLLRVIDADTLEADLDLGWGLWRRKAHIRLAGLNAPELSTTEGKLARAYVVNRLAANYRDVRGEVVYQWRPLRIVSRGLDKYGRTLGDVYYGPDFAGWLNDELLANGYAVPM